MSLTQYLESQEDQDMIRLFNFLELKRVEEMEFFCVLWNEEMEGLYSSGGGNINGRQFNEGCKVEFNQPSCWLYFVPNLLVF